MSHDQQRPLAVLRMEARSLGSSPRLREGGEGGGGGGMERGREGGERERERDQGRE